MGGGVCTQLKTFYPHATGLAEFDNSSYPSLCGLFFSVLIFFPFIFFHAPNYLSIQTAVYRSVGPPGAQVSLEQQSYMLLTEPERQTMAYYLQEYQEGHIGVEPLAMALFELFNTHAKVHQLPVWLYSWSL